MAPFGTIYTTVQMTHPRARLALAAAAITGLEVTRPSDFAFGKTNKTPEYLSKFPLGKVPAFEGSDGFLLTEGNAIAYYITDSGPAAKRDQLFGATPKERAYTHQWWWFAFMHVEPAVQPLSWTAIVVEFLTTLGDQWDDMTPSHPRFSSNLGPLGFNAEVLQHLKSDSVSGVLSKYQGSADNISTIQLAYYDIDTVGRRWKPTTCKTSSTSFQQMFHEADEQFSAGSTDEVKPFDR